MVRRKEDLPAREVNIRVAKKSARVVEDEVEPTPKLRRPLRVRRSGGGGKAALVSLIIVVLLGVGWFGARAAILGMNLLGDGQAGWLATLFNIKVTRLIGEDEGRVNLMLMGIPGDPTHDGPNLTDTLILASYNTTDKYLHLVSIPRDLQVTPAGLGTMKINSVYQSAQTKNSDGPGTVLATVGELTDLTIPYYIKIDFAGFKQLVDELGGIKVDVKKDLFDDKYPADQGDGYQVVDIKSGSYTMDGDMALKYARSRETTSDFDRARRQQDIIMAMRSKANDLDMLTAPAKLFSVSDIIKDHMATNLNKDEMTRLMQLVADFNPASITNKVMDEASGLLYGGKNDAGAYVLRPTGDDYGKIKTFIADLLSKTAADEEPVVEEVAPLKVEVLNGTNTTGLAGRAAEKIKQAGNTIVRVGNNPTKGVEKTMVYGNGDAKLAAAIAKLAQSVGGIVATDTVTLPAGVEARVVLGADYPTQ